MVSEIKFVKVKNVKSPTRGTEQSAGIAFNKSGIAVKKNLHVGACVVDEDYQGELHLNLTNTGNQPQIIERGDKITQFVLLPVNYATPVEVEPKNLYTKKSKRGDGGFGSTGTK